MRWIALMAFVMLAGCSADQDYATTGSFTSDRTQADLDDFQTTAARYGADVAIMESFPEQFKASGMTANDCDALYEELKTKDYIQVVSACKPTKVATGPYEAVSP